MATKGRNVEITIERFAVGPLETNCYVVQGVENRALVFDPSLEPVAVVDYLQKTGLEVAGVVLTHGHFDHILGIEAILRFAPQAGVWCHRDEVLLLRESKYNGSAMIGVEYHYDGTLNEFDEGVLDVGGYTMTVIHIPGHSPGGCAFVMGKHCLVGDALFAGSIGRSDFPGGDGELLVNGIKEKLLSLPEDTICYPGHGGRTTIAREKRHNPFLV